MRDEDEKKNQDFGALQVREGVESVGMVTVVLTLFPLMADRISWNTHFFTSHFFLSVWRSYSSLTTHKAGTAT